MLFSFLLLLASATTIEVQTVDGTTLTGQLVSVSDAKVVLDETGAERSLEADQLQKIHFPDAVLVAAEAFVGLRDGTMIGFEQLEMAEGGSVVRVTHRAVGQMEFPLEEVRWVRFQPPRDAVNARWQEFVDQEKPADVLVIRRAGNVLDRIGGVVLGIEAAQVLFDLDGERIAAPRDRLEGIIFHDAATAADAERPIAQVTDLSGSHWPVATMSLQPASDSNDTAVQLETIGGHSLSLQLDEIVEISFSSAAIALDRLTPTARQLTPFHDLGLPEELTAALIGPQPVESTEGAESTAAVVMAGRSNLEYRVPEGVLRFTARVVMPRPTREPVRLRVVLDGKEALSVPLDLQTPQQTIDVDISGARRLLLDYDGFPAAGVGDRILIENARMSQ